MTRRQMTFLLIIFLSPDKLHEVRILRKSEKKVWNRKVEQIVSTMMYRGIVDPYLLISRKDRKEVIQYALHHSF